MGLLPHDVAPEIVELLALEKLAVEIALHLFCRTIFTHKIAFFNLISEEKIPHIQCS